MKKMNVLPFYMTYPTVAYTKENGMVEDLEYFQQMYLNGARMLQREIVKSISILDYDGSMIYDAYPDQFMLRRLSAKLLDKMKKQTKPEDPLYKVHQAAPLPFLQKDVFACPSFSRRAGAGFSAYVPYR